MIVPGRRRMILADLRDRVGMRVVVMTEGVSHGMHRSVLAG